MNTLFLFALVWILSVYVIRAVRLLLLGIMMPFG